MPGTDKTAQTDAAVQFALLQQQVTHLETKLAEAEEKLDSLEKDREHALRWGIMVLGTAVLSMGSWIFHNIIDRIPAASK